MAARVISSLDNDDNYFSNRSIMEQGLNEGEIRLYGFNHNSPVFNYIARRRPYDFIRTAGAQIRDSMVSHLITILKGIDVPAQQALRSNFVKLFCYYEYKDILPGQPVGKFMNLLIFKPAQCVVHVNFSCNTMKSPENHYTVSTCITCHKYNWFPFHETPLSVTMSVFNCRNIARVVSSRDGDGNYSFNRSTMEQGLNEGKIRLLPYGFNHDSPEFYFPVGRTYDFTRTAGAQIREAMMEYLNPILNGIDADAQQALRSAFAKLFDYDDYKGRLKWPGHRVGKTVNLLIFKPTDQYVAHVNFSCNTIKGLVNHYTVSTSITCHKYTWFPFQETLMSAFDNLAI